MLLLNQSSPQAPSLCLDTPPLNLLMLHLFTEHPKAAEIKLARVQQEKKMS